MKSKARYLFPIIVFVSIFARAGGPLIKTNFYYADGGESLGKFLEYKIGIPKNFLQKGNYQKIKSWNPRIADPSSLQKGEQIYVEVPYQLIFQPRTKTPTNTRGVASTPKLRRKRLNEPPLLIGKIDQDDDKNKKSDWNFSMFYALSTGTLIEKTPQAQTKTNQNSPITLGVVLLKPMNNNFYYSSSLYISKLNSGETVTGLQVSTPLEFGLNSYANYHNVSWPFEIYSGINIERLSSYNTDELSLGKSLSTREHTLGYLTLGISKKFKLFRKSVITKMSFSKSIISTQSRPSLINPNTFTGNKLILYVNILAHKKWFYHALYKQHNLKGATNLIISRTGIGIGYIF